MKPHSCLTALAIVLVSSFVDAQDAQLTVDFAKTDGTWTMPSLALGQGGLQSDPMIEPHIKEIRTLRPRTIRLFLSEYYRIYPDHDVYDFSKLAPFFKLLCELARITAEIRTQHVRNATHYATAVASFISFGGEKLSLTPSRHIPPTTHMPGAKVYR